GLDVGQCAVGDGLEQLPEIAFHGGQDDLRLRIAEPAVELYDLRAVLGKHQAGVENAAHRRAAPGHLVDDRLEDRLPDFVRHRVVDQTGRRVGTHAAGVRPFVVVVGTLVVAGRGERIDGYAVRQGENRDLRALHALLDEDGDTEIGRAHV